MSPKTVAITLSQFCETSDRPREILQEAGFVLKENKTGRRIRREEMMEALKDADAVLAAVEPYDAELLSELPKLRCISRCGAGVDNIDLAAAKNLQIEVLATRDEIVEPVAQMTVGMIFALLRNFTVHKSDFMGGEWKKHAGLLLSEVTIGLVGFGRIGRKVEEYLRPFSPKVMVCDPQVTGSTIPCHVTLCDFDFLLSRCNVISLHASRPADLGPLLGREALSKMKRGSFLINTARGYLTDETALEEAIRSGHLRGVALDVFEQEPYRGPLVHYPNVLATPHVATLTQASRAAMELKAAENIIAFFG